MQRLSSLRTQKTGMLEPEKFYCAVFLCLMHKKTLVLKKYQCKQKGRIERLRRNVRTAATEGRFLWRQWWGSGGRDLVSARGVCHCLSYVKILTTCL